MANKKEQKENLIGIVLDHDLKKKVDDLLELDGIKNVAILLRKAIKEIDEINTEGPGSKEKTNSVYLDESDYSKF